MISPLFTKHRLNMRCVIVINVIPPSDLAMLISNITINTNDANMAATIHKADIFT